MHRTGPVPRLRRFIRQGTLFTLALALIPGLIAQEETPYTLHVYTNLLQIDALVLSHTSKAPPLLDKQQFNLRLDSGPVFHPLTARRQGDDPMSVAILIDTGYPEEVFHNVDQAFASLAPLALTPRDHVAIFAVDCKIIRIPGMIEADPEKIKQGIKQTLDGFNFHGNGGKKSGCLDSIKVWDAFAAVEREIATQPGHRVIMALTQGLDNGSINTWRNIQQFAHSHSITIFAVRDQPPGIGVGYNRRFYAEDPLLTLSTSSGGIVLNTEPKYLSRSLNNIVHLLRNHYILKCQRPSNATAGLHIIDIKVSGLDATVLSSGTLAAVADDAILKDPNTIPSDTSRAPVIGTRKPITTPR